MTSRPINGRLSLGDYISLLAIVIGVSIFAVYVADQLRQYNFVDIKQPVETDKDTYRIGEVVYGFFYGEVYTNNQPVVLRRMECATQRMSLVPVVASSASPVKLTGKKTPIIKLDSGALSVKGVNFEPDTGCFIEMCNVYSIQPIFGNLRSLGECYNTAKFNIVTAREPEQPSRGEAVETSPSIEQAPAMPRETQGLTEEQAETQTFQGAAVKPDNERGQASERNPVYEFITSLFRRGGENT